MLEDVKEFKLSDTLWKLYGRGTGTVRTQDIAGDMVLFRDALHQHSAIGDKCQSPGLLRKMYMIIGAACALDFPHPLISLSGVTPDPVYFI